MKFLDWGVRIVAAAILFQTLYFKFLGAEESVFIFSELGVEPLGRYVAAVAELAAAVMLLIPRSAWIGALLGMGVMSGAILSHVFVLGIAVQGDGGLLFGLALVVFAACGVALVTRRSEVPVLRRPKNPGP